MSLDTDRTLNLTLQARPRGVIRETRLVLPHDWRTPASLRPLRNALSRDMLRYHRAAQLFARELRF